MNKQQDGTESHFLSSSTAIFDHKVAVYLACLITASASEAQALAQSALSYSFSPDWSLNARFKPGFKSQRGQDCVSPVHDGQQGRRLCGSEYQTKSEARINTRPTSEF